MTNNLLLEADAINKIMESRVTLSESFAEFNTAVHSYLNDDVPLPFKIVAGMNLYDADADGDIDFKDNVMFIAQIVAGLEYLRRGGIKKRSPEGFREVVDNLVSITNIENVIDISAHRTFVRNFLVNVSKDYDRRTTATTILRHLDELADYYTVDSVGAPATKPPRPR